MLFGELLGTKYRALRRTLMWASAVFAVTALAACGSSSDSDSGGSASPAATAAAAPAETAAETTAEAAAPAERMSADQVAADLEKLPSLKGKTVAYISVLPIEYLTTSYNSARAAVEELGGKLQVYNSAGNPNTELANVKTAIAKGVSGLLVFSTSPAAIPGLANLAHKANIPIIHYYAYVDQVKDKSVVDAWVGADAVEIGRGVGELMASKLQAGDEVAEITGFAGTAEVSLYKKGFDTVMEEKGIKIVSSPTSNWDRQKAFQQTQQIVNRYPNLKGLFCHNDDTMAGCVAALRAAGKKPGDVALATLNVSPTGLELIKQGWMLGGVQQSPPLESAIAARLMAQFIAGEKPPLQEGNRCWAASPTATQDNVDAINPVTLWTFTAETTREALVTPCVGQSSIFPSGA
jgi:ABC-type sugar transport system substrate-binding protein